MAIFVERALRAKATRVDDLKRRTGRDGNPDRSFSSALDRVPAVLMWTARHDREFRRRTARRLDHIGRDDAAMSKCKVTDNDPRALLQHSAKVLQSAWGSSMCRVPVAPWHAH